MKDDPHYEYYEYVYGKPVPIVRILLWIGVVTVITAVALLRWLL